MADLSGVTTNFLATASETFEDNLSASITAGATIVPVNNASEYVNGDIAVITVDAGTNDEATFVGRKNGNQFEDCIWTEGNVSADHASGAPVVDYDSATHYNLVTKALKGIMEQDGSLKADPIREALNLSSASTNGWEVFPNTFSVASGYNKGNKSFELSVPNQDITTLLSKGMRLRLERNVAAPTQSAAFVSASSQYGTKSSPSGIAFTDDFSIEAWVYLDRHSSSVQTIASRWSGTSGWRFFLLNGQVYLQAHNAGSSNWSRVVSTPSVPTGQWVHIAAQLDMSGFSNSATTSYIMIDGNDVTSAVSRSGTNPTALVQAGNLEIGSENSGTDLLDGRVSDLRLWSAKRTQLQVQDNMNQQLTGSETNLVGYWKLDGNFNDSTANANNFTASGGAISTYAANPMNSTQYAIITNVAYSAPNSVVTVFTGTDNIIPNMTLISPYYSTQRAPYGFPASRTKWRISVPLAVESSLTSNANYGAFLSGGWNINVPVGQWRVGWYVSIYTQATTAFALNMSKTSISGLDVVAGFLASPYARRFVSPSASITYHDLAIENSEDLTAPTLFTVYSFGTSTLATTSGSAKNELYAECAYV